MVISTVRSKDKSFNSLQTAYVDIVAGSSQVCESQ